MNIIFQMFKYYYSVYYNKLAIKLYYIIVSYCIFTSDGQMKPYLLYESLQQLVRKTIRHLRQMVHKMLHFVIILGVV